MSLASESKAPSEEPIFDVDAPPKEPLNEDLRLICIYTDLNKKEKKTKLEEEWNLRMTSIQEWFIRCSSINKYLFLKLLCKSTSGLIVLENVLKSIEPIFSKDVLESNSKRNTKFAYDKFPTDDNRVLEEEDLNAAMKEGFVWFINMDYTSQVRVILRLLRLGGGSLIFMIYKLAVKLLGERRAASEYLALLKREEAEVQPPATVRAEEVPISNKDNVSEGSESLRESILTKQARLERRNEEFQNYKKLRGILDEDGTSAKEAEPVDYLQILPISVNRRIMSYIDEKTLSELKKVGRYWSKMIDESINEKSARKAINAKINKIIGIRADREEKRREEKGKEEELELINELGAKDLINAKNENEFFNLNKIRKPTSPEDEWEAKRRKLRNFKQRSLQTAETYKNCKGLESRGAKSLGLTHPRIQFPQLKRTLIALQERYKDIFSSKASVKTLDATFYPGRCGACNTAVWILACSTANNFVYFYSLRTGARLNFIVFGLESTITCLSLHENNIHIFIGCRDGSVICKDFRTNNTTATFKSHTDDILSIFTTSSNLLSASKDNTVKYFQLWTGICLLCINLNPDLNVSSALLRSDKPHLTAIGNPSAKGTVEGVLVLANLCTKNIISKVKLHSDEIKQLAHDEQFLITGSESGKVRVWNMHLLADPSINPRPYYDVNLESPVTCLKFFENQIFCGCENGSIKIISLAKGKISKSLDNLSETPITGFDIIEDKTALKLVIWHEAGVEIRTFPIQKPLPKKQPKEKSNSKGEQRRSRIFERKRQSETVKEDYIRSVGGSLEIIPGAQLMTTYEGHKMPLNDRLCTISTLRVQRPDCRQFKTDVFAEIYNASASKNGGFLLCTFPRNLNVNSQ